MWSSLNEHNFDELATAMLREEKLYSGLTLLNFVGNHDVARIASTLVVRNTRGAPAAPPCWFGSRLSARIGPSPSQVGRTRIEI